MSSILVTAPEKTAPVDLSVRRMNFMRAGYLLMGVGLAVFKWPRLINHDQDWPLFEGVVTCILTAMSLLAFLGLRYPVKLLPLLLFESAWKTLWLLVVALPKAIAGQRDGAAQEVTTSCYLVVVIMAVTPWRYVWQHYILAKGSNWR